ncbi:MAG: inner membrane-spanning protein YciB [Solimonas sp.]
MNAFLDFLPALLFLVVYKLFDVYVASGVLIASTFALLAWYWFREKRVHKVHLFTAILASVLGGLTIYLHNDAIIQYKPTLLYGAFALAFAGSQLIGEKVLLERLGQKTLQMPSSIWRKVNMVWALFFVFLAGLNIYVAQHFSYDTWVYFKFPGTGILTFVFLFAHAPFLKRYFPES